MGWLRRWLDNRMFKKEQERQKAELREHARYYYPKRTKEEEINIYKKRLVEGETENSAKADLENVEYDDINLKETDVTDDESINYEIYSRKRGVYTIPGVDHANYEREPIKKSRLTRPTKFRCPKCQNILYNTMVDGEHYYCPNCDKQYKL